MNLKKQTSTVFEVNVELTESAHGRNKTRLMVAEELSDGEIYYGKEFDAVELAEKMTKAGLAEGEYRLEIKVVLVVE